MVITNGEGRVGRWELEQMKNTMKRILGDAPGLGNLDDLLEKEEGIHALIRRVSERRRLEPRKYKAGGENKNPENGDYQLNKVGHIFYYNQWNGIRLPEIAECFTAMPTKAVTKLKVGAEVWRDLEPYHPNGKVYGYSRLIITRRQKKGRAFEYEGLGVRGGFSSEYGKIFRLTNPRHLGSLVREYGSRITDPFSPEQRASYAAFEQAWDKEGLPR